MRFQLSAHTTGENGRDSAVRSSDKSSKRLQFNYENSLQIVSQIFVTINFINKLTSRLWMLDPHHAVRRMRANGVDPLGVTYRICQADKGPRVAQINTV